MGDEQAPAPDNKLVLGLLIGGALLALRMATSKRNLVQETLDDLGKAARQGIANAKQVGRDEVERQRQERRSRVAQADYWKVHVAPGADQAGAIVFYPGPTAGIGQETSRWRPTNIIDLDQRQHLAAEPVSGERWHWMVHENFGNYPMLFELHGTIGKGYRPGYGLTTAFTIEHAHRRSFFPFRDTLYGDTLPLDRIAAMINLHARADDAGKRVIVDNREAWRAANDRAEGGERAPRLRLYPRFEPLRVPPTPIEYWAGSPDPIVTYDAQENTTFDPRTGLSLTVMERGGPEPYRGATISDAGGRIEHFPIEVIPCHRPDYGETRCITMQEPWAQLWGASNEKPQPPPHRVLTREEISPLLNAHPSLFWRHEHLGHAAIIDHRIPWHPNGRF